MYSRLFQPFLGFSKYCHISVKRHLIKTIRVMSNFPSGYIFYKTVYIYVCVCVLCNGTVYLKKLSLKPNLGYTYRAQVSVYAIARLSPNKVKYNKGAM